MIQLGTHASDIFRSDAFLLIILFLVWLLLLSLFWGNGLSFSSLRVIFLFDFRPLLGLLTLVSLHSFSRVSRVEIMSSVKVLVASTMLSESYKHTIFLITVSNLKALKQIISSQSFIQGNSDLCHTPITAEKRLGGYEKVPGYPLRTLHIASTDQSNIGTYQSTTVCFKNLNMCNIHKGHPVMLLHSPRSFSDVIVIVHRVNK